MNLETKYELADKLADQVRSVYPDTDFSVTNDEGVANIAYAAVFNSLVAAGKPATTDDQLHVVALAVRRLSGQGGQFDKPVDFEW